MTQPGDPPRALRESCVDSAGAYLLLRERGITDIVGAVRFLHGSGRPSVADFDVIADGLFLYELELEDDLLREELSLRTLEVINELDKVGEA